jgi:hypothetical protein
MKSMIFTLGFIVFSMRKWEGEIGMISHLNLVV